MNNLTFDLGSGASGLNWGSQAGPMSFSGPAQAARPHPMVPMPNVDMSMGSSPGTGDLLSQSMAWDPSMTMSSQSQAPLDMGATRPQARPAGLDAGAGAAGGRWDLDNINTVLGGLGMLGKLWAGFQSNRIAQDSLDFQKKAFKENLSNQRQSYNTAISDRANARYTQMGTPGQADDYIRDNSL